MILLFTSILIASTSSAFAFLPPPIIVTTRAAATPLLLFNSRLYSSTLPTDENNTMKKPKVLVSTSKLLSSLIDAACHGSQTIRNLCDEARSGENIKFKEEGDAKSAMTIADTTAQKVIVSSLVGMYPNLDIVGEEDESVDVDMEAKQVLNEELFLMDNPRLAFHLPRELAEDDDLEEPPEELDLSEVVVFVDPLDGTREFVEGRLDNVQCLIGLVYRGVPLMGVLGLPFPSNIDNSIEAVFGLVGRGSGKCIKDLNGDITSCPLPELKRFKDGNDIYLSTGDSTSSFMCAAIKTAEQVFEFRELKRQIVGATGNKLLRVACGESTLTVQHDKTSLWDTAAPTAVLVSLGGHITDIFGDPLIYEKKELGNKLGVVASAPGAKKEHLGLVNAMRSEKNILSILNRFGFKCDDGSSQCVDIVRDLDGYPLSASYFAEKMKIDNIESYSCPEEEAVRGLMSNACRVNFLPSGDTAFYKRIVFAHLDHARNKMRTAPHKLIRDVKSYQVETSFLSSTACKEVIEKAGLKIPTCFDAKLMPDDQNPIASKFSVLLEDFSPSNGWSQKWLLRSDAECKTTLTALAKMHAFFWSGSSFWNDDEAAKELENGVWESASYVQPKLQTLNQCKDVAKGWNSSRIKCKNELDAFDFWDNLGERLETVAEECGRLAHPFALDALSDPYKKYRTFTHGDPKQANIFFRENGSVLEVGLIDFQWSGFGLAATDIAHFLTAAVHAERLENGGEEILLRHYFGELQKYLVEFDAFRSIADADDNFGYTTFFEQYQTGVLDMCRLVIAYAWSRFEPVDNEKGHARTMNKNSYNKSMPNVIWLMSRCDEILKSRGV